MTSTAPIDLGAREFWNAPWTERYAAFAALRHTDGLPGYAEPEFPGFEPGPGFRVVTRHADVEEVSRNPDRFCSGRGAVSILDLPAEAHEFFGSLISMDAPRHTKIRRIAAGAFTPKRVTSLVDDVERIADEVLGRARATAAAHGGEFDLVTEIAAPLPLLLICDMMGIPESRREDVFTWSNMILAGDDPEYVSENPLQDYLAAGGGLSALMTELAADAEANPRDDVLSALVHGEVDGERLTHQEIASFFILLCVAGNETTRNAVTHGVWALHLDPAAKRTWADDLDGVTPTAIDEIVRWASPINWMRRTAVADTTVGDVPVAAGEKLLLVYGSANRDEAVFTDPDRLDLRRSPNPHHGFGAHGPHFCLGAHLARREAGVMFRRLLTEMADLEVVGEPDRLSSIFVNGIKHLPVRLPSAG
ncbi:cytochrome P450 [Actinomycetospora sp. TBRC 11914]|uniref:cytochrome P450 n=1 Tax=Actinomycetospora sp. TBRC 11914 TaxID=2729387 RepID=UPI00145FA21F|nr:cytochrome P450 [Actinomycetospora sp. TBRC 11914]NMO92426.1 cytochrome P450 [Actinomycetospora sp. TBRC 11914]